MQQGQVFRAKTRRRDGDPLWAYRYRAGGRDSSASSAAASPRERDAAEALERALERLRREQRRRRARRRCAELVEVYLAQHDAQPETTEKLRWLLGEGGRSVRRSALRRAHARKRSPPGG